MEKAGCKMYHLLYFLHADRQSIFMLSPPILVPFCCCGASVPSTNVLFSSLVASVPEKMIPGENPKHEMDGLCGNTSPACKDSPRLSHEEAQKNPDCSTCFQMALRRLKKAADNAKWSQMVLDGPIKLQMVPEGPRMPTESSRRRQMAPEGSPQMAPEGTRKLQESREGCRRPHNGPTCPQKSPVRQRSK